MNAIEWVVWQATAGDLPGRATGGPADRVWLVLRPKLYLTRSEVAARSGCTDEQTRNALQYLSKRGRAESARIGNAHGYRRKGK